MDTKWMNGKFVLPVVAAMSLGLVGCSESSEDASYDDAAAAVEETADDAATTNEENAATDAAEGAAADAADAVEEAVENIEDPTGGP